MIGNGTRDDKDDPPRVPMIIGAPLPKQKHESMTSALVDTATAFAKVLSPSSNALPVNSVAKTPTLTPVAKTLRHISVSPSKLADIWMKNLEQLRCMKKLMDGVLSQEEFVEQKEIILQALRDL